MGVIFLAFEHGVKFRNCMFTLLRGIWELIDLFFMLYQSPLSMKLERKPHGIFGILFRLLTHVFNNLSRTPWSVSKNDIGKKTAWDICVVKSLGHVFKSLLRTCTPRSVSENDMAEFERHFVYTIHQDGNLVISENSSPARVRVRQYKTREHPSNCRQHRKRTVS